MYRTLILSLASTLSLVLLTTALPISLSQQVGSQQSWLGVSLVAFALTVWPLTYFYTLTIAAYEQRVLLPRPLLTLIFCLTTSTIALIGSSLYLTLLSPVDLSFINPVGSTLTYASILIVLSPLISLLKKQ